MTKPCIRCLLSEIEPGEELEKIKKLSDIMPEKEKASREEISRRLTCCKSCEKLNQGTCIACGCYVEIRTLKKKATCPINIW